MIPLLLIGSLMVNPGAPPTEWKPLAGVTGIHYRWSRPTSNSCIVEFGSTGGSGVLHFQVTANVTTTNPPASLEYNPDSPMNIESTKIKPQKADRVFTIQLPQQGENSQYIHDCYGVGNVTATKGLGRSETTSQALPKSESPAIH